MDHAKCLPKDNISLLQKIGNGENYILNINFTWLLSASVTLLLGSNKGRKILRMLPIIRNKIRHSIINHADSNDFSSYFLVRLPFMLLFLKVLYFLSSSGAFGEVWQAQCSPPINGTEFVAVKCLKVSAIYNIKALASARGSEKTGEKSRISRNLKDLASAYICF